MGLLRRRRLPEELVGAYDRFLAVVEVVESAKEELVAAVPGPRTPGVPLAEALFAFSASLQQATEAMPAWRVPALEERWLACERGIAQASSQADRLRTEAPELGFEALLGVIGDILAPLEEFEGALDRFMELRR